MIVGQFADADSALCLAAGQAVIDRLLALGADNAHPGIVLRKLSADLFIGFVGAEGQPLLTAAHKNAFSDSQFLQMGEHIFSAGQIHLTQFGDLERGQMQMQVDLLHRLTAAAHGVLLQQPPDCGLPLQTGCVWVLQKPWMPLSADAPT